MRKAARTVTVDDMINIVADDNNSLVLSSVLRGHLAAEALLVELLLLNRPTSDPWELSFPGKTKALADVGLIDYKLKAALDTMNGFRNDYSHIFGFSTDIPRVLGLAKDLAAGGVEFTDGLDSLLPDTAAKWYDDECGLLSEIFKQLLMSLAHALADAGGRDLFSES